MSTRKFRAIPLTPIHIGTGQGITPEEYLLERDVLVRFNASLALRKMSPGERAGYEDMLDKGKMQDALVRIRGVARQHKDTWVYQCAVGSGAREALSEVLNYPERKGEVSPLPRNAKTGDVVIPGSAIKGAIRTAVLSSLFEARKQQDARFADEWLEQVQNAGRELGSLSDRLQGDLLGSGRASLERDPFRLLRVSDATLASSETRVDRCRMLRRDGTQDQQSKIQMHVERTTCQVDGGGSPGFPLSISVEEERTTDPRFARCFDVQLSWKLITDSLDGFYRRRFNDEANTFGSLYSSAVFTTEVLQGFTRGYLIRVGRFSHFESLSVEGLRRGENRVKHTPIYGMGSSRTACELRNGRAAPFGWMFLEPLN